MDEKFRSLLSAVKHPLGLEFLIYLDDGCDGLNDSNFYCSICSNFGNIKNMIRHIKSRTHVLKFLKTLFPKVIEAFNFPLFMNSRGTVESGGFLEILAKEIEFEFGRGLPCAYENISLKNKWKTCFIHKNKLLSSRNKPDERIVEKLIKRVQRKRAELKIKKKEGNQKNQHLTKKRSPKPCGNKRHLKRSSSNENRSISHAKVSKRSWSRSPLKNRIENLQRKRRRERSSSKECHVEPW